MGTPRPWPLRRVASLPGAPHRHVLSGVSVSGAGGLALLYQPEPGVSQPAQIVFLGQGGEHRDITVPSLGMRCPIIAETPSGNSVIVDSRTNAAGADERRWNGLLLNAAGDEEGRFFPGDGVEDVQVDADGRIWVSYFDEGVFPNLGTTPDIGATEAWRLSSPAGAGLARFSPEGALEWFYEPTKGYEPIYDCYALNVTGPNAWACYYREFALVWIGKNGRKRYWHQPVEGANGIVVDERHRCVAMIGGYDTVPGEARLLKLDSSSARSLADILITIDGSPLPEGTRRFARGTQLHALHDGGWYVGDLSDLTTA